MFAYQFFIECAIIIFHLPVNMMLQLFLSPDPRQEVGNEVVIVDRWMYPNALHLILKYYLENKGFRVTYVNVRIDGSFEEAAKQLQMFLTQHNIRNPVLIGNSGGGIVCLAYAQRIDMWKSVRHVVCVGAPLKGAVLSWLLPYPIVRSEMRVGSMYLQKLMMEVPTDKVHAIYARDDNFVGSENSYVDSIPHTRINVFGHNYLHSVCPTVYWTIRTLLHEADL